MGDDEKVQNEQELIVQENNNKKMKENEEEDRDKKAFDKIREYLHLTASAVKIKYPTVKNMQSDELIKKVKDLPFYKYHDQMVRIMESQIKQIQKEKNKTHLNKNDNKSIPHLPKQRSSFLSIFNFFGGGDNADDQKLEISDIETDDE